MRLYKIQTEFGHNVVYRADPATLTQYGVPLRPADVLHYGDRVAIQWEGVWREGPHLIPVKDERAQEYNAMDLLGAI